MSFDSLVNIALIVIGFGLLVGIHELGHFLAAKWAGIRTNAFAIGMGPQLISYRKGIGFCYQSTRKKVIARCGKDASEMTDEELQKFGISETEYSLRSLPIAGFVSMLGQEDGKPDEVSEDPRSYNRCAIGKRMVVVSAGVIMNLLLAGVFFLICFQIGVQFEAPVIGHILPDSPASKVLSEGGTHSHLRTGDTIVSIDGDDIETFQEVQIASAMAKPGIPVTIQVRREGHKELLRYSIMPESVTQEGLLEIGLYPASSLTLRDGKDATEALQVLAEQHPELDLLSPGMTLVAACTADAFNKEKESPFVPLRQWQDFQNIVTASNGTSIITEWADGKALARVEINTQPKLDVLRPVGIPSTAPQNFEFGYLGFVPLSKVSYILESSPNKNVFLTGDVILKLSSLEAPRMGQLRNYLSLQPDGEINLTVLRNGEEVELNAMLEDGKFGVLLASALELPVTAAPLQEVLIQQDGALVRSPTPLAGKQILAGSTLLNVCSSLDPTSLPTRSIASWSDFREQLDSAIHASQLNDALVIQVQNPTKGKEIHTVELSLESSQIDQGWSTALSQQLFQPLYVTRSSGGNPLKAIQMGFDETINMVVMTYLTIDRLIRRTVGVDQLRGPVGIIHIGSKIADRGISYLLFFLAIISVNLAVLNFLPLPIVDGGLFLYLIYEKLFKKPPSIAFQNAAAMLGLGLIATLFVVTFYNDIIRLVG